MDLAYLGGNVRYIRLLRRLSQLELANRAGSAFSQSYVSRLECGLRPSDSQHVSALATALEVSPDALLRRPRVVRCASALKPVVLSTLTSPEREP